MKTSFLISPCRQNFRGEGGERRFSSAPSSVKAIVEPRDRKKGGEHRIYLTVVSSARVQKERKKKERNRLDFFPRPRACQLKGKKGGTSGVSVGCTFVPSVRWVKKIKKRRRKGGDPYVHVQAALCLDKGGERGHKDLEEISVCMSSRERGEQGKKRGEESRRVPALMLRRGGEGREAVPSLLRSEMRKGIKERGRGARKSLLSSTKKRKEREFSPCKLPHRKILETRKEGGKGGSRP